MAARSQPAPEPKQSGAPPICPFIAVSRHCLVRCAALPARYRPSVSRLIARSCPPAAGREVSAGGFVARPSHRRSHAAGSCSRGPTRQKRIIFCLLPQPAPGPSGGSLLRLRSAGPHSAPPDLFLTVLQPLSSSLRQAPVRASLPRRPSPCPLCGASARWGPAAPSACVPHVVHGRVPLASVARLIRPVCLLLPAPLPGCGRIAWPKRGQLRRFWQLPKTFLAPCWAGGLCVHSRHITFWISQKNDGHMPSSIFAVLVSWDMA